MPPTNRHAPETPNATGVERTIAILECLDTTRRGLNISEVSRKIKIPKSSAHVLMVTLERVGYVRRAPNGRDFVLDLKAYALGQRMAKTISIAAVAMPHMQTLAGAVGMCAHLAALDHDQGLFIQKANPAGTSQFDTYVGRRMDLHCTSLGKVLLAFSPPESTEHILSKKVFAHYTTKSITSGPELRREISRVKAAGYSTDDEEEEIGTRCVAVPVIHEGVRFLAALSVSGNNLQMQAVDFKELLLRLKQCSRAIVAEDVSLPTLW